MQNQLRSLGLYLISFMIGLGADPINLSSSETFFIHRLSEFWKDGDFPLVKKQIQDFLVHHLDSPLVPQLKLILADILYEEMDYNGALAIYSSFEDSSIKHKIALKYCHCLYLLEKYPDINTFVSGLDHKKLENENSKDEILLVQANALYQEMRRHEGEAKKLLAQQAKALFLQLFNTSYKNETLAPLIVIHELLEENTQAVLLLSVLAEQNPEQKENLLFQAAALQIKSQPQEALRLYQKITDMGMGRAAESAYLESILLLEMNQISIFLERKVFLDNYLSPEKQNFISFLLGYRYFKNENYIKSIESLSKFLEQSLSDVSNQQTALLILSLSAQKTENWILFDQGCERFISLFPENPQGKDLLLTRIQHSLQKEDFLTSLNKIELLLSKFPQFAEKEMILYNYAIVLKNLGNWDRSRQACLSLLSEFPECRYPLIWQTLVFSSCEAAKQSDESTKLEKTKALMSDLKSLFNSPIYATLSAEEKGNYLFLMSRLLFEGKDYETSKLYADLFFKEAKEGHPLTPQLVLIEICLNKQLNASIEQTISSMEKALTTSLSSENRSILQLELFNMYLMNGEEKKAADILYQADQEGLAAIQEDNRLWLSHYYYQLAKEDPKEFSLRAKNTLSKALGLNICSELKINENNLYLEPLVFQYVELSPLEVKKDILLNLKDLQTQYPLYCWMYQEKTVFELGQTFFLLQEDQKALEMFQKLSTLEDSPYAHAAQLQICRIDLRRNLTLEQEKAQIELEKILTSLKDLQLQKNLFLEPVYLEAGLDYVDIRALMVAQETQLKTKLFFLNRLKQDFNSTEQPSEILYHENRLQDPEKDKIFQTYMKYIEAEILLLQAQLAQNESHPEQALQCSELAKPLLQEVLNEHSLTPYLKDRLKQNIDSLRL